MSDLPKVPEVSNNAEHPFTQELRALMLKHDVLGITVYVLPEDLEKSKPSYNTFSRGHFYDTAQLISNYVKDIKAKLMQDFDGLM